jgi:hypothetical protein
MAYRPALRHSRRLPSPTATMTSGIEFGRSRCGRGTAGTSNDGSHASWCGPGPAGRQTAGGAEPGGQSLALCAEGGPSDGCARRTTSARASAARRPDRYRGRGRHPRLPRRHLSGPAGREPTRPSITARACRTSSCCLIDLRDGAVMSGDRDLTDQQWAWIEPLLPSSRGKRSRPFRDHRPLLDGII